MNSIYSHDDNHRRSKALSLERVNNQIHPKEVNIDALAAVAQLYKKVRNKYQVGMVIQEGYFASVRFCTSKHKSTDYLLRVIQKAKVFGKDDKILQEIRIMRMMRHENVMTVLDYWETSREYCMVMESIEYIRRPNKLTLTLNVFQL